MSANGKITIMFAYLIPNCPAASPVKGQNVVNNFIDAMKTVDNLKKQHGDSLVYVDCVIRLIG